MKKHTLGNYLRTNRLSAGLTQLEVSTKLGYSSAQFISNFERGLCSPPLKQLKKISQLYSLEPNKLIELMMQERLTLLETTFFGKKRKTSK